VLDPSVDRPLGANPIDRFLELPMATIAPFDRIGGRFQELVVQEPERLLEILRANLLQDAGQGLVLLESTKRTESIQLSQGRLPPAPAVEQIVEEVHQGAQVSEQGTLAAQPSQDPVLTRREMLLDPQGSTVEEFGPQGTVDVVLRSVSGLGATPAEFLYLLRQVAPDSRQDLQDRLVEIHQAVEPTDLMPGLGMDFLDDVGIQRAPVGGDPFHRTHEKAGLDEEIADFFFRDLFEDSVPHDDLCLGIDGVDNREGAIVDLIDGEIPACLLLHPRHVLLHEADFFPPPEGPTDEA